MIESCFECKEKIEIMPTHEPYFPFTVNNSTIIGPINMDKIYSPTKLVYKCPNPKCCVTKIYESWDE